MMWEVINRDRDGWINIDAPWLSLDGAQQYDSVGGVEIDIETGKFFVKFTPSPPGRSGLFTMQDMHDIFENGLQHSLFTLDPPSNDLQYHPFHQLKFSPASLEQAPNFLQTLLHADYLLKMISMGVEVSSNWPHTIRSANDGFMRLLPQYLRDKVRPVTERRGGTRKDSCHRFWIESDELECAQVYDEESKRLRFVFGRCRMHVKTQLMKHNADGELVDDSEDEDDVDSDDDEEEDFVRLRKKRLTAEAQFANDFTEVYDDIGSCFPVLLRLRELMKILAIHGILNSHYERLETAKENLKSSLTKQYTKMFTALRSNVPYPQNTSRNVDKYYRKLLADQGINESRLASGEEDRAKRSIRQQLQQVEVELVSNLTTQLSNQLAVSDCSDFAKAVRNWLDGGFFTNYTRQLVDYLVDRIYPKRFEELDRFRKNAASLGVKLRNKGDDKRDQIGLCTLIDQCPWVPAAFCRQDLGRVYGGVCLIPQLKEVPNVRINNTNASRLDKGFVNGGVTSTDVKTRYYADENGVKHRKEAPSVVLQRGHEGRVECARSIINERNLYGGTGTTQKMRSHVQHDFGRSTDQAGHVIGFVLGGSGSQRENIVPLSGSANRTQWHTVEKNVAQAVATHGKVMYSLEYMYTNANSTRPHGFTWRYSHFDKDGKVVSRQGFIDNPK